MADPPRATVELPRLVCQLTGAPHRVEVRAADTHAALDELFARHPGVRSHLVDDTGALRVNVLCAVDGTRDRLREPRPLRDGSTVRFVPSVAGG